MSSRSATQGHYLVYLYSTDLTRVCLSFALGVTHFVQTFGDNKKMRSELKRAASSYAGIVPDDLTRRLDITAGPIDLSATARHKLHTNYEASAILSVEYSLTQLPPEAQLREDFLHMVKIYRYLLASSSAPSPEALAEEGVDREVTGLLEEIAFEPSERGDKPGERKKLGEKKKGGSRRSGESVVIGNLGEDYVLLHERARLTRAGRADLAARIEHPAREGRYPGYDIKSYEEDGTERLIEVKASKSPASKVHNFEMTANEWRTAKEPGSAKKYCIYLVTEVTKKRPQLRVIRNPAALVEAQKVAIEPSVYKLSF